MTARVIVGGCREVMAELAPASVDAVLCDPPLFQRLKRRVGSTVARVTQRSQVAQLVGFSVVGEQAEGANVMHGLPRPAAVLASSGITRNRRSPLRLPVRSTVRGGTAKVLRVERTDSVSVPALTGAKLPLATCAHRMAWAALVFLAAPPTRQRDPLALLQTDGRMLTLRRARLAPPVSKAGSANPKHLAAGLTRNVNLHPASIKQGVGR